METEEKIKEIVSNADDIQELVDYIVMIQHKAYQKGRSEGFNQGYFTGHI